jgi:hypothetical protein
MKNLSLVFAFISLFSPSLSAQNRFVGGAFAGLNLAQIDGDYQQGYRKKMFTGGIRAAMILTRNFDIGTELIYNGRGSEPNSTEKSSRNPNFYMTMHYAEAALMANIHFDETEGGFNQKSAHFGISYGRLLRSTNKISNLNVLDTINSRQFLQENLKNTDVNFIVGFSYRFTPKIGVSVRHSYSITPFFEKPIPQIRRTTPRDYFLVHSYFLSFHLFYDLWTPELRKAKKKRKK